ncbi:autotransporter strand-loop-strand O-heptosyltransferase [Candidatus Woesearchaeota archaeon]|nr:autotransporter strand-loop-strand O-heptosyltransferase [Candidatus Woesearchaeota archaeon]
MTQFVTKFKEDYALLRIVGDSEDLNSYIVEFINENNGKVEYSDTLKVNYWARLDNTSDKNITIRITSNNKIVFERNQNKKYNRVYVLIGSDALGDIIAWVPCVEEYRKTYNVDVVLYTKHKYLFDKAYSDIIFTDISNPDYINDVDKKFRIDYGPELYILNDKLTPEHWVDNNKKYDNAVESFDYRTISLQSIAKVVLGLPLTEVIPKINIPDSKPKIRGKYVVVAIQSTAQLKYWNNPFGWERVFDFLGRNGYKILLIDKYKSFGITGHFNRAPKSKYLIDKTGDIPLSDRIIDIKYADMMITISSGLAWLSWAVGTPVIMISGFTDPSNEFQSNIIRIHNKSVCNSCWNDTSIIYDSTDWMFCPRDNDFVCSKVIQPKDVTDAIKKLMK